MSRQLEIYCEIHNVSIQLQEQNGQIISAQCPHCTTSYHGPSLEIKYQWTQENMQTLRTRDILGQDWLQQFMPDDTDNQLLNKSYLPQAFIATLPTESPKRKAK